MRGKSLKDNIIIGPWAIDPNANDITAGDQQRRLTPKAMQVLMLLIEADGEVLTRTRLMDEVGLSDEGLSRLVNEVREALGDQARAPRYIETIPRRGYRLIHSVSEPGGPQASGTTWRWIPVGLGLAAAAVVGVWTVLPRTPETPAYQLSRVIRLTPAEERAILPHVSGREVQFVKLDPRDDRSTLMQLNLETLIGTELASPAGTLQQRSPAAGSVRMRHIDEQCALEVPTGQTLPCRTATGGLALNPELTLLAYEHPGGGLGLVDLATGQAEPLTSPPEGLQDSEPSWSDGGRLAFIRGDEVRSEVYLLDAPGNPAEPISEDHQAIFDLAWLNSNHLLVASDRTGTRRLWALDTRSDVWTDLHQPDVWRLSVQAPDVVFERPVFRADILRWDGASSTPVVHSARFDNHPAVSPDGRHLAFVSMRNGVPSLWFSKTDGQQASLLRSPGGGRITRPVWQDNAHLSFLEYTDADVRLRSITLDRTISEIDIGGLKAREAAYDRQGQLHLIGEIDGVSGLYRMTDQGPVRLLAGDFQRLVATGDHLLLGDRSRGRIRLFDLSEGARDLVRCDSLHWTASGNDLYFVRDQAVHRYRIDQGDEQRLSAPLPSTIGLGLAVNPVNGDLFSAVYSGHQAALYHLEVRVGD